MLAVTDRYVENPSIDNLYKKRRMRFAMEPLAHDYVVNPEMT